MELPTNTNCRFKINFEHRKRELKTNLRGTTGSPGIGTRIVMSRCETVTTELAIIAAQTAQGVSGKENA